jgi:trimeric autotransporter adhesin
MPRIRSSNALFAMLVLALCTGTMQASILTSPNISSIALTCDLVNGPGAAQTVGIELASVGSTSVTASVPVNSPVAITTATQTVASISTPVTFSFKVAAGCAGVTTSPQAVVITFTPATGATITVTANITITSWIVAIPSSAIALTCDTILGPGPAQPVNIKLAGGSSPVSVTVTAASLPGVLPITATQSVTSSSTATVFNFQAPAGCAGITSNPQIVALTFTAGGVSGPTIAVNAVITVTGSSLTVSPSAVSLSCNKSGGVISQSISVTSTAVGGTHFYANPTGWPSWLTTLSGAGSSFSTMANATAVPVIITFTPTACTSTTAGTYGFNVHLVNSPGADQIVAVTLTVGATDPLTATPSPVQVTYTKAGASSAVAAGVTVTLHNANSPTSLFYALNTATLPSWLNVDIPSTAFTSATKALTFTATSACAALANGSYSANVHFVVSGYVDLIVTVDLLVQNPTASLTLVEGSAKTINWVIGTPIPTVTITPISTDQPIEYNVTFSGIVLSTTPSYGIAYSFGSPIAILLDPSKINGQAPGTPLTGIVTVTPASGGALVYTITFNVLSPGSQITGIFPAALPVASSGSFNVTLTGTGFVKDPSDLTQQTKVGVVTSGYIIVDGNIAVTVVNSTTITLVISVVTGDPLLPFSGTNTVYLGVCNPGGTACSAPTTVGAALVGQVALSIGSVPIIQAVTSAASFIQATPPALPTVAPYDILSIFGTNFCMIGATGCTGANSILYGTLNQTTLQYMNSLTPDQTNYLSVKFLTHGTSTVLGVAAPLLFATNGQINVLVPSAVAAKTGSVVDLLVTYGPNGTNNVSLPYSVLIAATDPGVFTAGGDGVGSAAALDHNYNLIGSTNPAGFGATGSSDTVTFYVTGLGVPDTDGLIGTAWGGTKCITTTAYYNAVVATGIDPLSDDGLVIQSALYVPQGDGLPPCFKSTDLPASSNLPIVKIGGVAGTIAYAGWVPDSVAGLYQINVMLPSTTAVVSNLPTFVDATGATVTWGDLAGSTGWQLPVVISSNSVYSQPTGVYVNVKGRLQVTAPSVLTGTNGVAWTTGSTTSFTVTGGPSSASYTFSETTPWSGALGLTLNSDGTVTGTAGTAASYSVSVTVTDSVSGFTGTLAVTYVIN